MTAAFEAAIEHRKRRSRFVTQAEIVGQKVNKRSAKRKKQWDEIQKVIANDTFSNCGEIGRAEMWKQQCQAAGIGAGVFSFLFWNFFLPYLIELAKNWIEANRDTPEQGASGEQ